MKPDKKIYCPKCDSSHTELISYVYRCIESENAGHRLFVGEAETALQKKREFSPEKKEKFLKAFKPPVESKLSIPSLTVALMAFFLSWLVVGAMFLSKIGGRNYFIITLIIIAAIAYPFYSTFLLIIDQMRKNYAKYRKSKNVWIKKRYCYDCEAVFTLEPEEKKAKEKTPPKK
ncbi:MAG: hypothetical protein P9M07_06625 [Candidatus Aceula meridiana]|nr:hypothetical protein [Candidatus Aceula meridiana]